MNVSEAARSGSERDLLVAMRDRIADAITDPDCPRRELASLTLRLSNITRELAVLDSAAGADDLGEAMGTPDEPFDPDSL